MDPTTLSSKGQVINPKSVRDALQPAPGAVLRVVAGEDAVLPPPGPLFAATLPALAAGCLKRAPRSAPAGRDADQPLHRRAADEDLASLGGA